MKSDLSQRECEALKALVSRNRAFGWRRGYRCYGSQITFSASVADKFLRLGYAEKRIAINHTPYLVPTASGRDRVGGRATIRREEAAALHERIAP